jgi:hypothetical protein
MERTERIAFVELSDGHSGPALDEPGALQQPGTVHVSEGSKQRL